MENQDIKTELIPEVGKCYENKELKQVIRIIAIGDSFIFNTNTAVAESNISQQLLPISADMDLFHKGFTEITFEAFKKYFEVNKSNIIQP